jgi:putative oxidoreductase
MEAFAQNVKRAYAAEIRCLSYLQPVFLLMIRLYIGWGFFKAGKGKLLNIESTAEFFGGLDIPMPTLNAYLAGATEYFGGLFLLLGAASRVVPIPLIFTMLVAYATAHTEEFHALWVNPNLFLKAPPFLFLLTAIIVLLFGPGVFSVDGLFKWRLGAKRSGRAANTLSDQGQFEGAAGTDRAVSRGSSTTAGGPT